jgi:hypothetical protein
MTEIRRHSQRASSRMASRDGTDTMTEVTADNSSTAAMIADNSSTAVMTADSSSKAVMTADNSSTAVMTADNSSKAVMTADNSISTMVDSRLVMSGNSRCRSLLQPTTIGSTRRLQLAPKLLQLLVR